MKGDFLGQAVLDWGDLEIGRRITRSLQQRKGVKGKGPVKGKIILIVGPPIEDVRTKIVIFLFVVACFVVDEIFFCTPIFPVRTSFFFFNRMQKLIFNSFLFFTENSEAGSCFPTS